MHKQILFPATALTICATILFFFWQVMYLPIKAEISGFQLEAQRIKFSEQKLSAFQARHKNLENFTEAAEETLSVAQEYLPLELDDEKFVAELYRLADDEKILVNAVKVGAVSNEKIQRQSIKIRLEADYLSLVRFLREILDGERFVSVENFSVESDGDSNILDCELEIFIYAASQKS